MERWFPFNFEKILHDIILWRGRPKNLKLLPDISFDSNITGVISKLIAVKVKNSLVTISDSAYPWSELNFVILKERWKDGFRLIVKKFYMASFCGGAGQKT